MNLGSRQNKILNLLFKHNEGYMSSEAIADRIGVTNKTIQSDINAINDFLTDYPIYVVSSRGKGYRIAYEDDSQVVDIINSLVEINEFDELDFQRAWLICYLIHTEKYVTQKEIMDTLYISLNQTKELFRKVLSELYRHKLRINSVSGSGFQLVGDEIFKRLCFVYYYKILNNSAYYHELFIEHSKYLEHASNPVDIQIIYSEIKQRGYRMSENNQEYLLDYLVFSLNRKYSNHRLSHSQISFGLEEELLSMGREISNGIFEGDSIEAIYAAAVLKFIINESSLVANLKMNEKDARIIQLINNYFLRRQTLFENSLQSIDALQREITNAIILIVCKNSLGYREVETEITQFDLDDEFVVAIEYAVLLMFKIESDLGIEFFKDDIYRLASIFNIHFKIDVWDEHQHIYIYSDNSRVKQRYLQRKILQRMENVQVEIVDTLASFQTHYENAVLVTDHENIVAHPNIRVGNFKSLMRYNEIIKYIGSLFSSKERNVERFLNLFDETRYIELSFQRRSEIVEYLSEKYHCDTERKATIQENIYIRESRYFGTVVNTVAYPRIYVNSIEHPCVEVIKLKEPVLWNGIPVKMVIANILPNSYNSLAALGKPFHDVSTNVNLMNELYRAKGFSEFLLCLRKSLV